MTCKKRKTQDVPRVDFILVQTLDGFHTGSPYIKKAKDPTRGGGEEAQPTWDQAKGWGK